MVPFVVVVVQRWCTRHPPNEQLLVGVLVGAPLSGGPGPVLVLVLAWYFLGPGPIPRRGGPWCSFLLVVSARRHPLTLPSLQAGACSSGNGWWVGVVVKKKNSRGAEHVSVMCRTYGAAGCLPDGYPLLGSPGVPLRFPRLCRRPHIPFKWGGGDWVAMGVHWAFFVVAHRYR